MVDRHQWSWAMDGQLLLLWPICPHCPHLRRFLAGGEARGETDWVGLEGGSGVQFLLSGLGRDGRGHVAS